jgi:hypothetical protein
MADNIYGAGNQRVVSQEDQFTKLLEQQQQLIDAIKGTDEYGGLGGGAFNPARYGVKAIKDIEKTGKEYKTEQLPALFDRYLTDIAEGRLTPSQASTAYEAAARGAGQLEGTIEKASKLARSQAGVPSAEKYIRYTPFFQQTAQQMLGRTLSDPEIQNYVGAFQGMGISNPADVAATFGKYLTTSDEYKSRQYRFKPAEMPTFKADSAAFAQMLNTTFG